jgi:hypothetical protein
VVAVISHSIEIVKLIIETASQVAIAKKKYFIQNSKKLWKKWPKPMHSSKQKMRWARVSGFHGDSPV